MKTKIKKKKKLKNKFETRIDAQLTNAKVDFDYEAVRLPYTIHGNYIPDFVVPTSTGTIYLETKGYFRPEAKRKMVAVKQAHPELDIRLIFYSATKTNVRWATKYGFKFAFHRIPDEWIEEIRCGV